MTITNLKYANAEHTLLKVTTDSGEYSAPWPCHTWHAQEIQAAIDSGVIIEDYLSLTEIKSQKQSEIKSERDRRTVGGYFTTSVQKWFHSDQFSRSQQLGLIALGANIPAGLQWKTMDGSFVTMTQALAQEILVTGALSDQAIFAKAQEKISEVEALVKVEEVVEYSVNSGWPLIFGE